MLRRVRRCTSIQPCSSSSPSQLRIEQRSGTMLRLVRAASLATSACTASHATGGASLPAAAAWCEENGASTADELVRCGPGVHAVFVAALKLPLVKRTLLEKELRMLDRFSA